ncbi:Cortactin-binding protein like [Heracleum sosnowskyi]|uniref:Cortactin-binding protein like n=1 Tax=Heracleum sosnowskyi TaxID=360622 RepID=A0AAD8IWL9_9APIA|nr:Cortactin-binding protein like [Heracleum sosnowskyi]
MSCLSHLSSIIQRVSASPRWPLILYATTWTTLLTVTVAVASFSPELAFVSVISSKASSSYGSLSRGHHCRTDESVRVPMDIPTEIFCIPAEMFRRSKMDLVVPPVFAAVIVACSAYVVRALALWEDDTIVEPY